MSFNVKIKIGYVTNFFEFVHYQVNKLIAIDPAGPIWDRHPVEYRLHRTDADIVHVLHTSDGFVGLEDPIGDVDFYPNGLNNQPVGCPNSKEVKCGCRKIRTITPPFHHNQGKLPYQIYSHCRFVCLVDYQLL